MNRYATPIDHLPDPLTQSEFYADVTVKRGLAWVIDAVLILALVVPVVVMTAFIGLFFLPVLFLMSALFTAWPPSRAGLPPGACA